jgi:hypothetical protein
MSVSIRNLRDLPFLAPEEELSVLRGQRLRARIQLARLTRVLRKTRSNTLRTQHLDMIDSINRFVKGTGVMIRHIKRKIQRTQAIFLDSPSAQALASRSRSQREIRIPQRFHDIDWVPGSNNGHTAGREIDTFERQF